VDPLGYVPGRSVDENTLFKPAPLQVVSLTEGQQLDLGSIEIIPARPVELVGRCIVPLPENKTKQQVCDSLSIDVLFNDPRLPRPEGGWRGDDGTVDLEGQFRVVTDRSRKQVFLRLHSNGLFPGSLVLPIDLDSATNGRIDLGDLAYP
jgi:hypothetical protein